MESKYPSAAIRQSYDDHQHDDQDISVHFSVHDLHSLDEARGSTPTPSRDGLFTHPRERPEPFAARQEDVAHFEGEVVAVAAEEVVGRCRPL